MLLLKTAFLRQAEGVGKSKTELAGRAAQYVAETLQQKAAAATRGENIVDAEAARVAGSQSFALRHAQEQLERAGGLPAPVAASLALLLSPHMPC